LGRQPYLPTQNQKNDVKKKKLEFLNILGDDKKVTTFQSK
jgi:hypothetical protein